MEGADIAEEVRHLARLTTPGPDGAPVALFDNIYWQLNTGFDAPMRASFPEWVSNCYNPGISRLVDEWVAGMREGRGVLGIVPFTVLMDTILAQRAGTATTGTASASASSALASASPSPAPIAPRCVASASAVVPTPVGASALPARPLLPIRCGIGHNTFAITTDGRLGGCPCGIGEAWNCLGFHDPAKRSRSRHPDLEVRQGGEKGKNHSGI